MSVLRWVLSHCRMLFHQQYFRYLLSYENYGKILIFWYLKSVEQFFRHCWCHYYYYYYCLNTIQLGLMSSALIDSFSLHASVSRTLFKNMRVFIQLKGNESFFIEFDYTRLQRRAFNPKSRNILHAPVNIVRIACARLVRSADEFNSTFYMFSSLHCSAKRKHKRYWWELMRVSFLSFATCSEKRLPHAKNRFSLKSVLFSHFLNLFFTDFFLSIFVEISFELETKDKINTRPTVVHTF